MPADHWEGLAQHVRAQLRDASQASEADTADLANHAIDQADWLITISLSRTVHTKEVARRFLTAFRYLDQLGLDELAGCLPHLKRIIPARGMVAKRMIEDTAFEMEELAELRGRGRPISDKSTSKFADYLVELWTEVTGRSPGVGGGRHSMINTYRILFWAAPALQHRRDRGGWDGESDIEQWLEAVRLSVKRRRSKQASTKPKRP